MQLYDALKCHYYFSLSHNSIPCVDMSDMKTCIHTFQSSHVTGYISPFCHSRSITWFSRVVFQEAIYSIVKLKSNINSILFSLKKQKKYYYTQLALKIIVPLQIGLGRHKSVTSIPFSNNVNIVTHARGEDISFMHIPSSPI